MQVRTYTLAEARAALPQVKLLMAKIQVARQAILRLRPTAWPALQKAAANGGSKAAGEVALHTIALEEGVKGILAMGIYIKDLDHGILDFLGMRDGHEVLLCWRYGEDELNFWHDVNAGFGGRQAIDGLVE
jgi:hypothetical protein